MRNRDLIHPYDPRKSPRPPPSVGIFDEPTRPICVNVEWVSHLDGVIARLLRDDAWIGDDETKFTAVQQIGKLLVALAGGESCMPFDPCCPEEIALLTEIRNLNQLIVNGQNQQIADNVVLIENQYTNIVQNAQNTYNNLATASASASFQNQIFWNGEPKSMGQDVPDLTFTSSSEDSGGEIGATREDALCAAVKAFMDYVILMHSLNLNLASVAAAGAIAAGLALAGATAGLSAVVGFGVGVGAQIAVNIWNTAVSDQSARRKVACCMYDALKDAPIEFASFKTAINDCGFELNSNESLIAANIYNEMQSERNFIAFCRSLQENFNGGNSADCACNCDDDVVLYDVDGTGTVITPMGECIYRFVQSTPIYEEPHIETPRWYHSGADILGRCLHWENSPDPTKPTTGISDHWVTNCEGVDSSFIGGFTPGDLTRAKWRGNPEQFFKITLVEE